MAVIPVPPALRAYRVAWLRSDILAGITLAAVAIPETMGYTSIAQMPVVTGLYTVIFPTLVFALLGSSRLLVVGADSATAAILAAGLAAAGDRRAGTRTRRSGWPGPVLVALVCGGLLVLARLLRLGFLGDFLSASVLIGFLTGVGIQVFSGQIPDMLGIPKGSGQLVRAAVVTDHPSRRRPACDRGVRGRHAGASSWGSSGSCRRSPARSSPWCCRSSCQRRCRRSTARGGGRRDRPGRLPADRAARGSRAGRTSPGLAGIAFSCFVLIIAQSAATSRSFAMRHGQRVDVNRDIVGLSGANVAAGLTGTFVVNGSPTKTQILDEQKGRTQVANMTMSVVVLVVLLFLTGCSPTCPRRCWGPSSSSSAST